MLLIVSRSICLQYWAVSGIAAIELISGSPEKYDIKLLDILFMINYTLLDAIWQNEKIRVLELNENWLVHVYFCRDVTASNAVIYRLLTDNIEL